MTSAMAPPTRWGIAAASRICHDFASALQFLATAAGKHVVVAVAARDKGRAEEFAKDLGIPKAYGGYEDLAKDPDVDVVYIGSIPSTHVDIAKVMMAANKPVLIEKPASVNYRTTKELVDFARERKVLCVEGLAGRFYPAFQKLREVLESGEVGEVKLVQFNMGFKVQNMTGWHSDPKLGGGVAGTFGSHPISLAKWIFGEDPIKSVSTGDMSDEGYDKTSTFVLHYSGERTMVVTVSTQYRLDSMANIFCTNGIIKLPDPWCPTSIKVKDKWYEYPLPENDIVFTFVNCEGYVYEADHMRDLLLKGETESPVVPHQLSLDISRTLDTVKRQLGVDCSNDQ